MKNAKVEWVESVLRGCFLGLVLFAVSLVVLSTGNAEYDFGEMGKALYLLLFLGAELLAGILISLIQNLPRRTKTEKQRMFAGIAGLYLVSTAAFLVFEAAVFLPAAVRVIIGSNLVILAVWETIEYWYTHRLSKQMNQKLTAGSRTLIIDLPARPKSKGEYLDTIIHYAAQSHLDLEIIEDEYPAVIKLNNVLHKAEIESWYGFAGVEYSLKITEVTN